MALYDVEELDRLLNRNGGPAFPIELNTKNPIHIGMTLRDWFAAQVLTGLLSGNIMKVRDNGVIDGDIMVKRAYEFADAMLRERAK